MIKTLFLVPVRDNEHRPFRPRHWKALRERITSEFGGFTRQGGISGVWASPQGRAYTDRSWAYTIALTSWSELPAWLDLVRWVRWEFRQEAIEQGEVLARPLQPGGTRRVVSLRSLERWQPMPARQKAGRGRQQIKA